MKVAYAGSPEAAVPPLRALAGSAHDVVRVVTQRDKPRGRSGRASGTPVAQAAEELGIPVLRLHPDRHRAGHLDADLADGEAALEVGLLLVGAPGDLGVHERDRRFLVAGHHDREAAQRPHLRGGEPHAAGVVHDPDHPLDVVAQRVVELRDRQGRRPQHGVAELADLLERGESPALQDGVVEGA